MAFPVAACRGGHTGSGGTSVIEGAGWNVRWFGALMGRWV